MVYCCFTNIKYVELILRFGQAVYKSVLGCPCGFQTSRGFDVDRKVNSEDVQLFGLKGFNQPCRSVKPFSNDSWLPTLSRLLSHLGTAQA